MAKWITYELRSRVESVERRLSHALDYLGFWSMHKDLAKLPNKAFDIYFLLLYVWDVLGSHPHDANVKSHNVLCSAHQTQFLLVQKCTQVTASHRQICGGREEGTSGEAVLSIDWGTGVPAVITGGVRNHNSIFLIMLGLCLSRSFSFPVA